MIHIFRISCDRSQTPNDQTCQGSGENSCSLQDLRESSPRTAAQVMSEATKLAAVQQQQQQQQQLASSYESDNNTFYNNSTSHTNDMR